jgi:hypothetical protein
MKRAEQAGDAVKVISMKMSDENRMNAAALDAGPHQLKLRAFAAIEQEHIAFANQRRRGQTPRERRHGGTCSEKYDFQNYALLI